jgi:hypothetical protein
MKLLQKGGSIISMVFAGVGFFWMYQPGVFNTDQQLGVISLLLSFALSFGLYAFRLRDRIVALEKRHPDRQ